MSKKKSNSKKFWTTLAVIGGAVLLFKDPLKKALGISGVSTEDLDRIKLLKDMGYFSRESREPWFQRELSRGAQRFREMQARRVGPDAKSEVADVVDIINNTGGQFIEGAAEWLVTGSYGSEFKALSDQWLNMLNTSGPKRLQNAWETYTKMIIQLVILIEWPSLNAGQLSKIWKMVDPDANQRFLERTMEVLLESIISNSGKFQD